MTDSPSPIYHSARSAVLPVVALLILALAPLTFVATTALWPRWIAILAVAWWLPGALLVAHWRLRGLDLLAAAVFASGLGLCWMILVALLVHWLPGPIPLWLLVAAYEIGALALLLALRWRGVSLWRQPLVLEAVPASTWGWVVALLILAAALRLPGIGYHEFHIDEVEVLTRASLAIQGVDEILARHSKGPGEIAIAMVVYRGLGTITEATGRLPFALLSLASVLATAMLGRRLFSAAVGFWAGVLLAVNGFALGLSRIVQYQPAVLLLSALAVLAAWEFAQGGEKRWLALTALFGALGLVLHYEFILLAPVLLALVWSGWQRAPDKRRVLLTTLSVGLLGAFLVAASYLPIVLDPHLAGTQRRLGMRLGGGGAFNVPFFVEMGTFYNSTYFFVALIALVIAGLILGCGVPLPWRWRTARRRTLLLLLWFAPALIVHLFIMDLPGTHFYLFMGSWSLLAALPLAAVTESRTIRPVVRWGLLGLVAVWLMVSAGYLYLIFFRQSPEYLVNYDTSRVPIYWAPYGKNVPQEPRFGFPIREGWKALGTLAKWECLSGTYATNEGSRSDRYWYLPSLQRVAYEAMPDWIFVADHVQYASRVYNEGRLDGYQRVGEVRVRDEPRIEIWAREPLPVPYVVYRLEEFDELFDRVVPSLEEGAGPALQVGPVALGQAVTLEGAGLEGTTFRGGDELHLLLKWRAGEALGRDYKLFVHVVDKSGRPVTQWDGFPCFNLGRTSKWTAGQLVQDHVLMRLPEDMAPGTYSVLTGLYDETTGERLGGQAVQIATITVR